jgi:DNA-binding transcriptional ArsR family regulator
MPTLAPHAHSGAKMLRIHFTRDDLLNTRVAAAPDPLWETLLSAHLLGKRDGAVVFGDWKRRTRARLHPSMRLFLRLAPPWGYSPDFLTPAPGCATAADGIDRMLSTPKARLRGDMLRLAEEVRLPGWARPLAEGDVTMLRVLGDAVGAYEQIALAPYWRQIRSCVEADRMVRARALLEGGTDGLLRSLPPPVRWEPPVLSVTYPQERDLYLNGSGLRLVPSFFCWRTPITLRAPREEDPVVFVYPIGHDLGRTAPGGGAALARLVGRTRAAVLAMTADAGSTTGGLADRLGITAPSASEHVAALREAGLVASRRDGRHVLHTLTATGADLLSAPRATGG